MAQLRRATLVLLFGLLNCFNFVFIAGDEADEANFVRFDNLAGFVLKTFNERPDALYHYKSAQVITGLKQNETGSASYYLSLDFAVACNGDLVSQSECFPKRLLCRVVVTEDLSSGEWRLNDENTKCNLPEAEPEQDTEQNNEPTGTSGTMEQQVSDAKAMLDDLGPFLMKHLNPLSESVGPTADADIEQPVSVADDSAGLRAEIVEVKKVQGTGGVRDVNTDAPGLQGLVEKALVNVDETSQYKHKLLRIVKAQSQVTNKVHYYLSLVIGETSCLKSSTDERADCQLGTSQTKTCYFDFADSEIKVRSCTDDDNNQLDNDIVPRALSMDVMDYLDGMEEAAPYEETAQPRERREVGGLKDIADTEKQLVHELAELAIATLDEIDADDSKRIVLDVLDAKKQLVNGVLYHLKLRVGTTSCDENGSTSPGCLEDQVAAPKICSIQLHRSFAADSPNDVKVVKSECTAEPRGRHRRSGVVGGYTQASPTDPYIIEIANFAVSQLDESTYSAYRQSVVKIAKAEKQVVAGTNVRLTLELVESTCRKNAANCLAPAGGTATRVCNVVVWDRPWLKERQLTSSTCQIKSGRRKRQALLGGANEIDVKDPQLQSLAQVSLARIEAQSNALYSQKIVRLVHATKQVVAGLKYTITMEVGYTTCRKPSKPDLCEVSENSNNQLCTAVVWVRSWLNDTQVTSVSCSPVNSNRVKRAMKIGGGTHDIHIGLFRQFMAEHGKTYASEEEEKRRFHIFRANVKKIEALQKTEQGTGVYGPTKFADLTSKEFKKFYLGLNPALKKADAPKLHKATIPQITLPPEFDWRNYSVVTPVKNQGMCGSCWAFSVTGNIEGQWALRHQELLSLSEQELVDCDKLDDGCKGGLPQNAYTAITSIGGLETEGDYPYDGADETCHFNKTDVRVTVTGGLNITKNETEMAQWLVKNGPISIGINANAMQFYMGGVSHPWKFLCNSDSLDHGVLIVGYGVHTSSIRHKILPYWIVKNSWGPSWGEKGYYRVYRGDGTCGVNQMATSAIVG